VLPLRVEKPIFVPLSKNNTSMAALRASQPVKKKYKILIIILYRRMTHHGPRFLPTDPVCVSHDIFFE